MTISPFLRYKVQYALNYAYENGNDPERAIKLSNLVETSSLEDVGLINSLLSVLDPLEGFDKTVHDVVSVLDAIKADLVDEYYYSCC